MATSSVSTQASGQASRDLVFVSYRRSDSSHLADKLASALAEALGEERVFFDTESIEAGQPFPDRIQQALGRARVLLVVIGAGWLKAADEDARRRIDDSEDWVFREIVAGLGCDEITVIPLHVDRVEPLRAKALPPADRENRGVI